MKKPAKRLRYTYEWPTLSIREANKIIPGVTQGSYATGVPVAIFAWILGKGEIETAGVIAPECLGLEVRYLFFSKLNEMKMPIHERMEKFLS